MNITLKKLTINNFKGIRNLEINFNHTTEISGKNEAGKSTIFDAYTWLLFGKNSEDVKDFTVKNSVNTSLNRNDHEVTGVLDVDGSEVVLKRTYREKWQTKRGSATQEFTGNETVYFYNDVPCSQNEYNSKIGALLSESIAKLITNPFAFNALKWEQRREVLTKIAGNVNDSDISAGNTDFSALLAMLNGKTLSDLKKEVSAKKKKIRETLDLIPARIDEAGQSKPESHDFDFIEKAIENKRKLILKVDEAISDKVKTHREESVKIIQNNNELNRLKLQLQNLEADAKRESQKEVNAIESRIGVLEFAIKKDGNSIQSCKTEIAHLQSKIEKLNAENILLRVDWAKINSEAMPPLNPDSTICPTCSQSLPADKIETIKADYEKNYNTNKAKKLAAINGQGQSNNIMIESYQADLEEYSQSILELQSAIEKSNAEIETLKAKRIIANKPIADSPEISSLKEKIANFVIEQPPVIDDAELKQRKEELQSEINYLLTQFSSKSVIEKTELRIKELENQERKLAQEIADLERTEFTVDAFVKAKMDMVELKVNQLFKDVSFKMFSKNINGGIEACCDCFYKGVPFDDANNAGRINAGLEIINVLSGFYNCYAPVWVDNAESVNEIYPLASQLIRLVVTTEPLKIS